MNRLLAVLATGVFTSAVSEAQFSLPSQGRKGPVGPIQNSIGNASARLAFSSDPVHGLVLTSMGDGLEKQAYRFAAESLWLLQFLPNGADDPSDAIDVDAGDCDFDMLIAKHDEVAHVWWQDIRILHPSLPVGSTAEVHLTARLDAEGEAFEFDLDVSTDVPGHSLYSVGFQAWFEERGPNASQVIAYPKAGGVLLPAPGDSLGVLQSTFGASALGIGEHPGILSMQWFAYYNSAEANPALAYFATKDNVGYSKTVLTGIELGSSPREFKWIVYQFPANGANAKDFTSPFPYVMGTLRGDWFDAARHYRAWTQQQPWTANGTLDVNPDASPLVREAKMYGVWTVPKCAPPVVTPGAKPCTNIPDLTQVASNWTDAVTELHTFFGVDSCLGTVTRFWDHNAHFDANWGEWLPLTSEFTSESPSMITAGNDFGLYFNPWPYSTQAPGFSVPAPANPNAVPGFESDTAGSYGRTDVFGDFVLSSTGGATGNCFKTNACGTPADAGLIESAQLCIQSDFALPFALHIMSEAILGSGASGFFLDNFTSGKNQLCYDATHGHPLGDGRDWLEQKIVYLERLRAYFRGQSQENGQFFSAPNPGMYLTSEAEQELYIGTVEVTRRTRSGPPKDIVPGLPYIRLAPLYQAVYHGYQLSFDGRRAISGPFDALSNDDPFENRYGRQQMATNVYFGHLPAAGLVVSDFAGGGSIASKLIHVPYKESIEAQQNVMVVHREPSVREFLVFGERMRDPVLTGVPTVLLEALGDGQPTFVPLWPGVDPNQPFVYANAHKRAGTPDEVGVAFINWTAASDDLVSLPNLQPGVTPGDQTFSYTIDPIDYELPLVVHDIIEVVGDGNPDVVLGTVDFSSGAPRTLGITVPERSLRFLVFKAQ